VADLSDPEVVMRHSDVLLSADVIFVDGPKDGRFQPTLLSELKQLPLMRQPLLVFDDIRLWNMLALWRSIKRPKLDVTSLAHWSGTGLVDWTREG
jgi:hypothetical protein